ncbi:hypothetical protein ACFL1Y_01210 [Patescibacteria group bacterium]
MNSLVRFLTDLHWVQKSFMAMVAFTPFMILIRVFANSRYQLNSQFQFMIFFCGTVIGMNWWIFRGDPSIVADMPSFKSMLPGILMVLLIGVVLGTISNLMFSQALGTPGVNPGIPLIIMNSGALIVFFLSAAFARVFPILFQQVEFSPLKIVGVVLTIAGLGILSWK